MGTDILRLGPDPVTLTLRRNNQHLQYQANTIKNTTVLSAQFLACEALRWQGSRLKILIRDVKLSIIEIKNSINQSSYA